MLVNIGHDAVEYTSDYPEGWKFSAGDPFKFPVVVGGRECFIKRFASKSRADISGWRLLNDLSGKQEDHLPGIFDIVEEKEAEGDVIYIFYEFLAGKTLEDMINRSEVVDLQRLTTDIFNSLAAIHSKGFWFADFCEKNVFCRADGSFLLIDLDSAQPLSLAPSNDMYGSKDYWIPVYKFYKEILQFPFIRLSDVSGMGLDYTQYLFLILHLKLYQESDRKNYRSNEEYDSLPASLDQLDGGFRPLFKDILQDQSGTVKAATITQLKQLIENKIIPETMSFTTGSYKGAIIHEFRSSSNAVKSGEPFVLSWIADADRLELYRNGALFQALGISQRSMERSEFHDSDKDVTYELVAYKDGVQSRSKPLIIRYATAAQGIHPLMAQYLLKAAGWARFVGIAALILLTFMLFGSIAVIIGNLRDDVIVLVYTLIILAIPVAAIAVISLLRFSGKTKAGLAAKDDALLIEAFRNISRYFVFDGIVLIALLVAMLATIVLIITSMH